MAEHAQTLAARDVHGTAKNLSSHVDDLYEGAVALRRRLHEWPEVGNHLPNTRDAVLESLEGLPLDITLHDTTSGIAAATIEPKTKSKRMKVSGIAMDSAIAKSFLIRPLIAWAKIPLPVR